MDTDRNMLFGVVAMQADLINAWQFIEACTSWTTRKDVSLADVLVERGWLLEADKSHLEYLLERKLQKDGGDTKASLAAVSDDVKRSLAALNDPYIQQPLAEIPSKAEDAIAETVVFSADAADRYELTRLYATGGIGRIWLAHDKVLGRDVALKDLRPEHAIGDSDIQARFLQEARITGRLEHPGIVPVYELAIRTGNRGPFYTMRLVRGRTLAEAVAAYHRARREERAERFNLVTLLNAFTTVCKTVAFAHSQGIVHRDLKPQNVVLGDFGEVVLLDWGLAKESSRFESNSRSKCEADMSIEPRLTLDGQTVGTPAYMAPEQANGRLEQIDHRTDVYGLGAMLYEILTGQPPFTGTGTKEVLEKVMNATPDPPTLINDEVPALLDAACMKALAKHPADRHASAIDLADQIERWQEVQRRKAELALQDSEALYRSLVNALPLILVRKDLESRFTFANNRFCEAVRTPLEQIIGKTDFDFFPAGIAEDYQRNDHQVFKTGDTFETEEEFVENGEKRDIQVIKTPLYDSRGELHGLQLICWDVTERKRLEQALEKVNAQLMEAQRQLKELRGSKPGIE